MCGIAGIAGTAPEPDRLATVREMCARLEHRGPDGDGYYDGPTVALGMRRLAIIDVRHGQQPFFSEDGRIAAVFNGEIYNFRDLRRELISRGHRLETQSDSECIPHLYEEFGDGFVDHLRGMFAIAIWDGRRDRLILVRDRLGKKPLYYHADGDRVAFASDLGALMVDRSIPRDLDLTAIDRYLTYQYVPAPMSAYAGTSKLPPAHRLIWQAGQSPRVERYWRLHFTEGRRAERRSAGDLEEELRVNLTRAVTDRLISERPLGAFLSGGLDSSAIVAAMARSGQPDVQTFSIGFDEREYNELPYARQVAQLYGTQHHEQVVRPDAAEVLPVLARSFGEPFADSSAIPSYYLAQMAREHVVVALNGDGGDEAFGGYMRYRLMLMTTLHRWPAAAAHLAVRSTRGLGFLGRYSSKLSRAPRAASLLSAREPAERYGRLVSYFQPEDKLRLYRPEILKEVPGDVYEPISAAWRHHRGTAGANRLLAVDTETYLPGDLLAKVDITTMAHSLEARSPLLDHELMQWAADLPSAYKIHRGRTKTLMKQALAPWLPPELIDRPKQGFAIPIGRWMNGPLETMVKDCLLDPQGLCGRLFRPETIGSIIERHARDESQGSRLYALLMLELWARESGAADRAFAVGGPGPR